MAMVQSSTSDHDQRLKVLLKEFFEQFFLCFFPAWASRFDFSDVSWLDKELFLAPPQGEKRLLDLVARLRVLPSSPPPLADSTELIALVHIEVESRDSLKSFRPRMFEYYTQLRREMQLPVLPIGLYLRAGMKGIGWDVYEEYFWEHRLLRFEYAYVGLPALDAETYATGEMLLGAVLSALMSVTPERRVELHAEVLKRIARSGENDYRQHLLAECVEAYADLNEAQMQQLQALLKTEPFQEARPLMITTFERGKIEGLRETALLQLEAKFGPLDPAITHRIENMTAEALRQLLLDLVTSRALQDLHLE
jgi:hypothetical protein